MIGESLLIEDSFVNLLLGHLAPGDAVVGIGGDGQLLGAVIDGEEDVVSWAKACCGEEAIDGGLPREGRPMTVGKELRGKAVIRGFIEHEGEVVNAFGRISARASWFKIGVSHDQLRC
ncbi:hypothetical protein DIE19_35690 [Burkholderia sp. Bp9126]|nr:hypothetical protein DIE19_35690 [Burkholderia sp. Bp9126]